MTVVATFQIEFHRFLDRDGAPTGELPDFARQADTLLDLYRWMVLTRVFDEKAIALQRTGRMGTYASSAGAEAIAVGVGCAMAPGDLLLPSYREHGAQLLRGVRMRDILLYWGGDERGSAHPPESQDFPVSVPVGSHACHAVGAAFAMQHRGQQRASVCVLGDGATSKGDFYESINVAGTWRLPAVFVVNNNQWAISLPRARQSAAETLAQKAIAAGFPGMQVDGNDVIAVRHTVTEALTRARNGEGPTLVEALSYRMSDHTTADDASRYRPGEELEAHLGDDPLARLRTYLLDNGMLEGTAEQTLREACAAQVQSEVQAYLDTPPQPARAMFDYLHATLPEALHSQREALAREADDG
jgi:pyruvate dehydrogenase E1 component alpha subunit